ncbi:hypothetical protein O3P69_007565 [Scylla paramamosain]|uniref:Uncharacterized protein n=1 Tax=Scylla paramamosain TaxID=85552 RepID=A0AAW0UXA3_SCYPA
MRILLLLVPLTALGHAEPGAVIDVACVSRGCDWQVQTLGERYQGVIHLAGPSVSKKEELSITTATTASMNHYLSRQITTTTTCLLPSPATTAGDWDSSQSHRQTYQEQRR